MMRRAVRVRRDDAELALAALMDLAPAGVDERDLGELIEYGFYGNDDELPSAETLAATLGPALVEVVGEQVADDWADRWRSFHQPVLISGRLHVRPPWSPPYDAGASGDAEPAQPVRELIVDPGRAFGTGGHSTTRLCLELLVALADEPGFDGGPVLDLGCGSGVLAVAAAQLGWSPVHGVDNELASVEATLENAAVNGVTVTADQFDLLRDGASGMGPLDDGRRAPLVLANLLRPLLLRVAADGFRGTPPYALIASGLLIHEADAIAAAFVPQGLIESERRTDGDWAALLLRRAA